MAFSSSWLFNSGIADSPFLSSSRMHNFEKIVEGVTGLGRKPEFPDVVGEKLGCCSVDVAGLNWTGGLTISSLGLEYCLLSWSFGVALFIPTTFIAAPSCAALPSDGPVSRCTTSRKVFVSVCTNVVKGLQPAVPWLPGFSMDVYFIWQAFHHLFSLWPANRDPFINWEVFSFGKHLLHR